jgi:hypothetical protein
MTLPQPTPMLAPRLLPALARPGLFAPPNAG